MTASFHRPRIVIVGAGFGGLYAARALAHDAVDVVVIDRTNHHLFQPLLYQVATATLAATDITAPIRWLLRKQQNAEVLLAEVTEVEPRRRVVRLGDGREVGYDYLILAPGSRHSYFGHDEWEAHAPGLKSIDDALEIRRRFLLAFEEAEITTDMAARDAWLTFVVVGGGPTGVELAGMLPTVARHALPSDFRHIDTRTAKVILLEGGARLLPAFPEDLSDHARRDLEELGVDVRLGAIVSEVGDDHVVVGGQRIVARTIFWAAGNEASPLARSLGAPLDRAGRVVVNPDLTVPGHENIYVVGDLATIAQDGRPVPGVCPAAMQMGRSAAANILRVVARRQTRPFRYRNKGDLATIGRYRAVAVIAGRHLSGNFAWWTWLFVHIMYLAGFRNRLSVMLEWAYAFFTYNRGTRLIVAGARNGRGPKSVHQE